MQPQPDWRATIQSGWTAGSPQCCQPTPRWPHLVLGRQGALGTLSLAAQLLRQGEKQRGSKKGQPVCGAGSRQRPPSRAGAGAAAAGTQKPEADSRQPRDCRQRGWPCKHPDSFAGDSRLSTATARPACLREERKRNKLLACRARESVDTSFLYLRFTSLMKYLRKGEGRGFQGWWEGWTEG